MIIPHAIAEEAVAGSAKEEPRLQGVKESTANETFILGCPEPKNHTE